MKEDTQRGGVTEEDTRDRVGRKTIHSDEQPKEEDYTTMKQRSQSPAFGMIVSVFRSFVDTTNFCSLKEATKSYFYC